LTSQTPEELRRVASLIVQPGAAEIDISRFTKWLEETDILENLKALQLQLDRIGVMDGDVGDEKFLAAMTLSDCTIFVKCNSDDPSKWEARIGDLDLKSKDKVQSWRGIERMLIEEGWYEGTENEESRQPVVCRLSRGV